MTPRWIFPMMGRMPAGGRVASTAISLTPTTQACAHVVLFSSDLDLSDVQLIDKYSLRFQIEFNFRDAKQYWGLEGFMHVQETAVSNAANFSLFMVNVA